MKKSLAASLSIHVLVVVGLLVSFSRPMPDSVMMIEPLPVELVPVGDATSIKKGDVKAAKADKPMPVPTVKPPVEHEGQHVGNNKALDTETPVNPKEKTERKVDNAPPKAGQPKGEEAQPAPVKKPQEKVTAAADAPPPEPPAPVQKTVETPKETAASSDVVPPPAPEKVEKVEKPEKVEEVEEAEKPSEPPSPMPDATHVPAPASKPKPKPKPQPAPASVPPKQDKQNKHDKPATTAAAKGETLDDILSLNEKVLLDRTKTSGGGTKRSPDPAAFGGQQDVGTDTAMQQTIANLVSGCIYNNWNLPPGFSDSADKRNMSIVVRAQLHADGTLDGPPELTPQGGNAEEQAMLATWTRAALERCAPFTVLAKNYADKYQTDWRYLIFNMSVAEQ